MCTLCRGEADRERDRTRAADLAQLFLGEMSPRKRFLFVEFFFFFLKASYEQRRISERKKKRGRRRAKQSKKNRSESHQREEEAPSLSLSLSLRAFSSSPALFHAESAERVRGTPRGERRLFWL